MINESIFKISKYYNDKIENHGASPQGVDWNGEDSQLQRFYELCKVINTSEDFSINDFGCGYGALYNYLINSQYKNFSYHGNDISSSMIKCAKNRLKGYENTHFIESPKPYQISDFSIASGVFNVKLDEEESIWKKQFKKTLIILNQHSKKGFSFNCLTSYSDKDKMKDYLYYADPLEVFHYCKSEFSNNISLLHDYNLYEFTILVKKQ